MAQYLLEDGPWHTSLTADISDGSYNLSVRGTTSHNGLLTRKLTLNSHTLTVDSLTVRSPHFTIEGGVINGDIKVEATGFVLENVTVNGSVTFASADLMNNAVMDTAVINGGIAVSSAP